MNGAEPIDELAEALRAAARGADPRLVGDLVTAARADAPHENLVAVAATALRAGIDRDDLVKACDAARLEIRTLAGPARNYEDVGEDHVLDLMDRLAGWCHPDARL